MIKNAIGRNSKLNKNKRQETFVKEAIRNSIENTGFFVVITNKADHMESPEKR